MGTRRARNAFLLSFLVYLLPVVHAHGGNVLGWVLWAEFAGRYSNREPLWIVMDVGLALVLQAAAFALFFWILGGRRWRWLLLVPCLPSGLWLLNIGYMVEIPKRFLIEADTRPETADWPVACEIMDASTVDLMTGVTLAMERAGEIWLRMEKGNTYGLLASTDCSVASRELFFPGARGGIGYVTAGGSMYYRVDLEGDGIFDHWYFGAGAPGATRLSVPGTVDYWNPTLAMEGGGLAWLETNRDDSRRITGHFIAFRHIAGGAERRIQLALPPRSYPQLLDFSLERSEFLIQTNNRELLHIGFDGIVRSGPIRPEGFESSSRNIRILDGGWVVWDGYRDAGRYRIAWSLPAGEGLHEIPKGRLITSLSVDPGGRYIAVSTSRNLSIGNVPDTLFVLRASDGTDIYRRHQPSYTRSHVGFMGPDRLAMSIIKDGRSRVRVLTVPRD